MLDGCRVVHVAQYLVAEGGLQTAATLVEELELAGGKVVERVAVAAHEVGEDGAWNDGVLSFQPADDLVDVFLRVEA